MPKPNKNKIRTTPEMEQDYKSDGGRFPNQQFPGCLRSIYLMSTWQPFISSDSTSSEKLVSFSAIPQKNAILSHDLI